MNGLDLQLWFSPNTKATAKGSATPPDLAEAFDLMSGANRAIFFLTFKPSKKGDTSVIGQAIDVAVGKPDLLVCGAISDGTALPDDETATNKPSAKRGAGAKAASSARTRSGKAKPRAKTPSGKRRSGSTRTAAAAMRRVVKTEPARSKARGAIKPASKKSGTGTSKKTAQSKEPKPTRAIYKNPKAPKVLMIRAAAVGKFDLVGNWEHELLRYGQAIIHDKIVVIDPFAENCVVITGSHNLGYKASYANDENMLIIKGNRDLATAYAVHILDVYEHYKWRAILEQEAYERAMGLKGRPKPPVGKGILQCDDSWQDDYFNGKKGQTRDYLLGAE